MTAQRLSRWSIAPAGVFLAVAVLLQHPGDGAAQTTPTPDVPPPPGTGESDRAYQVQVLTRIAGPLLDALSRNEYRQRFPQRAWESERLAFTHVEGFARTLAGVAPWLELGPDATPEGQERARFIELARQALVNATDPGAADFLSFGLAEGDGPIGQRDQALVEGAYLASALLRAPAQLWEPLTEAQKANVLEALRTARAIPNVHDNNWILFPAMIDAALWQLTGDADTSSIENAVRTFEDDWYVGDGTYGDGEQFHWDYYNSYVIHPFMLQVLEVAQEHDHRIASSLPTAMQRALRYARVQERLISPEGTFPVMGRSSAYRFAAFYHLSYMALRGDLPEELEKGAVRSALTAVVRRMVEAPGTFDAQGWLQLGAVGNQPGLQETYNSTGALYVCLTGLVHLGLPAADEYWTAPAAPWTQQRIWAGQDVPRDEALEE